MKHFLRLGLITCFAPLFVTACFDDGDSSATADGGGGDSMTADPSVSDASAAIDARGYDASRPDGSDAGAPPAPADTGTVFSVTAPALSSLNYACFFLGNGGSLSITRECGGDMILQGALRSDAIVELHSPDTSVCPIQGSYAKLADVPTDFAVRCPTWTHDKYSVAPMQAFFIRDNATKTKHFRVRIVSVDATRKVTFTFDALD